MRSTAPSIIMLCVLAFMSGDPASAEIVLDQANDGGWTGYGPNNYPFAQTFTCGTSGTLSSLEVYLYDFVGANVTVTIQNTTGGLPNGTVLATRVIPAFVGPQWNTVDVSSANIPVSPGLMLAYTLDTPVRPSIRQYNNTAYPGGTAYYYFGGTWNNNTNYDMLFRTYVSTVPEPTSIGLLGVGFGVLGLGALRRTFCTVTE